MRSTEYGHRAAKHSLPPPMVTREDTPRQRTYEALVSLTNTLRRLSHRCTREAREWAEAGNQNNAVSMELEADRLWRDALWNLRRARSWRPE
jgi:hypothetical protein